MSEKSKRFKFFEPIPDLWCPLCGEQVFKNGIKIEDTHSIDDKIVEDTKQKTIVVSCKNSDYCYVLTIEARRLKRS